MDTNQYVLQKLNENKIISQIDAAISGNYREKRTKGCEGRSNRRETNLSIIY